MSILFPTEIKSKISYESCLIYATLILPE
jgi:hypothetical protein